MQWCSDLKTWSASKKIFGVTGKGASVLRAFCDLFYSLIGSVVMWVLVSGTAGANIVEIAQGRCIRCGERDFACKSFGRNGRNGEI